MMGCDAMPSREGRVAFNAYAKGASRSVASCGPNRLHFAEAAFSTVDANTSPLNNPTTRLGFSYGNRFLLAKKTRAKPINPNWFFDQKQKTGF